MVLFLDQNFAIWKNRIKIFIYRKLKLIHVFKKMTQFDNLILFTSTYFYKYG